MGFLDTIGLEIEGSGLERNDLTTKLLEKFGAITFKSTLTVGRDASVESESSYIANGIRVLRHDSIARKCVAPDRWVLGYEITTLPLEYRNMERTVNKIMEVLISNGEVASPRSSTHVHIGYGHSLPLLRNAFALGLFLEPLFYKLAGMGSLFRGHINHSIYSRPLELSVAVPGEDKQFHSLLNTDYVFETKNTHEFWLRFGIDIEQYTADPSRYHPARYFGFNLLAVPLHGTLEFRHFNSCLNSSWIMAIVRFCQAIAELSSKLSTSDISYMEKNLLKHTKKSILEFHTNAEFYSILDKIEDLFDKVGLNYNTSREQRKELRTIIEKSQTPVFSPVMPLSHVKQYRLRNNFIANKLHPVVTDVVESGYLDIHNVGTKTFSVVSSEDNE